LRDSGIQKLQTDTEYTNLKSTLSHTLIFLVLIGMSHVPAGAQVLSDDLFSFDFRGESLQQALDAIARESGIDLVYDPELVRDKNVFRRIDKEPVTETLRLLLTDHDLDYITLSSGTIVIIKRAAETSAYGTLSGIIVDGRSGEPLPGATIMFADASGGTSTGQMGQFSINRLLSGDHTLIFSYVGYRAVTKKISISPNGQTRELIELLPRPLDILPIVVEAHRPQIYRLDLSQADEDLSYNYGSWSNTPIKDLSIIPGVKSGVPMTDISLQGGQESEHRLRLDGAPVYNTNSTGRFFSAFSPYAIGSVEVQRAGYDVQKGSQIAGLIDMTHELPAGDENNFLLQADPLMVNTRGNLTYRFSDEKSVSVMSLFRTNVWSLYQYPVLQTTLRDWDVIDPLITNNMSESINNAEEYVPFDHQSDLSFHDFHTAVRFKPNRYNSIDMSAYISGNNLETAVLNEVLPGGGSENEPFLFSTESYSWDTQMVNLGWSSLPTVRLSLDSKISYSGSRFHHRSNLGYGIPRQFESNLDAAVVSESDAFQFEQVELSAGILGNEIDHWIMKSDLRYSVSKALNLSGGIQLDGIQTTLDTQPDSEVPEFSDVSSLMAAGYLSGSFRFGQYWHLTAGSRLTFEDGSGQVYPEPRLSVQVDRPNSRFGYWSAKISGGLYRQFINEYRVSNSGAASVVPTFSIWSHAGTLPVPKAYHLTGSWIAQPSENSTVRVEGYLKWQPVTSVTSYRGSSDTSGNQLQTDVTIFAETTKMSSSGIGFRYHRSFLNSKLTLVSGYDFSYTSIDLNMQFGKSVSAPWNDPHRAQIRAVWQMVPDLTLIGKWQGVWGRRWAFRDSYYSYLQFTEPESAQGIDLDSPDNDRLPHFSQVDLSALYRPDVGKAALELRLDLVNILNRKNPLDRYLRRNLNDEGAVSYESQYRTLPGFYPTMSVSVTF